MNTLMKSLAVAAMTVAMLVPARATTSDRVRCSLWALGAEIKMHLRPTSGPLREASPCRSKGAPS
jgi:hypothetical protein